MLTVVLDEFVAPGSDGVAQSPSARRPAAAAAVQVPCHWAGQLPTTVQGPSAAEALSGAAPRDHVATVATVKAHTQHHLALSPPTETLQRAAKEVEAAACARGAGRPAATLMQVWLAWRRAGVWEGVGLCMTTGVAHMSCVQVMVGASIGGDGSDRLCVHAEVIFPTYSFEFAPLSPLQLLPTCLADTLRGSISSFRGASDTIDCGYDVAAAACARCCG